MNVRLSDELNVALTRTPVTVTSSRVNPRRPVGSIDITLGSPEDALAGWTNRSFIEMLNMPDADEPEGKQMKSVTRGRPIIPMQWNVSSEEVPVVPVLPPAAAKADTWKPTVLVVDDSSMNRKVDACVNYTSYHIFSITPLSLPPLTLTLTPTPHLAIDVGPHVDLERICLS